jgi:hypothetical protein
MRLTSYTRCADRFRSTFKSAVDQTDESHTTPTRWEMRVCVRKRPIFPHEIEKEEYDVISCGSTEVVIHDGRMHADMIHMFMNHHYFDFDAVFGEKASNAQVYAGTAAPFIRNVMEDGATATVVMYGQTGTY